MIHPAYRKGPQHHAALFTPEEVTALRERFERERIAYHVVARELGVSRMTVYRIVKRLTYRG